GRAEGGRSRRPGRAAARVPSSPRDRRAAPPASACRRRAVAQPLFGLRDQAPGGGRGGTAPPPAARSPADLTVVREARGATGVTLTCPVRPRRRGYTRPRYALLAQLVEHLHGKEGVDGSSPSE